MSTGRFARRLLPILLAAPRIFWAQTEALSSFNPLSASSNGVHLYGVTVYSGYYISGAPFGIGEIAQTATGSSSPTVALGAAATIGWSKTTEKSTVSITYSPSYSGSPTNSQFDGFSHRASLTWNRKLTSKWSLTAAASGMLANFQQLFFSQSGLSSLASSPATFDDLTSGVLSGTYTNAQVASLLTGAQLPISPEQTFYYGNRLLSETAHVGLRWAPTGRTSIQISVSGIRSQDYEGNTTNLSTTSGSPVVPRLTAGTVGLDWSYSLSPRTEVSVSATSTRTWSSYEQGYTSRGAFSLSRTLTPHWFTQLHAGAGVLTFVQSAFPQPKALQYEAGASLGYKTRSHTFLASYDRSIGDSYGLEAATTSSANGAWNWRRPGSTWSLSSSFGYQKLNGSFLTNTAAWRASAGISKGMGSHMFVSAQYGYFQFPQTVTIAGLNSTQNGVSLSVTWSPSTYQ